MPTIKSLSATDYFKTFLGLLSSTVAMVPGGADLNLDDGLQQAIDIFVKVKNAGGKVMIVGNGGSAAIASHSAIDLWKRAEIAATAFNDPVQLTCLSNDYGYEHVFAVPIGKFAHAGDLLVAISSSGRSPNILNAANAARNAGCQVITFAGFAKDAPLLQLGDLNFYVDSADYGHVEVAHLSLMHYLTDALYEMVREK